MATPSPKISRNVRPDSKGRITLGELASGVSSYDIHANSDGTLLLRPKVEVPADEAWLYRNTKALASVKRGLAQAAEGRLVKRSFAKHADEVPEQ
jgi:hypothetical protein